MTIHQPEFLPWLGFFHKLSLADVYVALDTVQYRHKYFQNRNRIRGPAGELWLNVPVLHKHHRDQPIRNVAINNAEPRWRQKLWRSLALNYHKAPHFDDYAGAYEAIFLRSWASLAELNVYLIGTTLGLLGLATQVRLASELGVAGAGAPLILDICRALDPDVYISGVSGIAGRGRDHESHFTEAGIEVVYQAFQHPIYPQRHQPFLPCMSIVDLLFNCGPHSLDVLQGRGVEVMQDLFT